MFFRRLLAKLKKYIRNIFNRFAEITDFKVSNAPSHNVLARIIQVISYGVFCLLVAGISRLLTYFYLTLSFYCV